MLHLRVPLLIALAAWMGFGCRSSEPHPHSGTRTGPELYESCLLCHSTREMQRGPILNGLPEWYLTRQLHKFHLKVRGNLPENRSEFLMASGMSTLRDTNEFALVARHIASLAPPRHLKTVQGDPARGKALYNQCIACHGPRAEGNRSLNSPPLNTLEDWYQLDQLIRFRQGLRGHHTNDIDGIVMGLAVQPLTSQDLRDVTHYIVSEFAP